MHRHDPALGICPDCCGAHCTQCKRGPLATNADTLCFDHTPGLTRAERAWGFNSGPGPRPRPRMTLAEYEARGGRLGMTLDQALADMPRLPHPLTDQAWLTKMRRAGKP